MTSLSRVRLQSASLQKVRVEGHLSALGSDLHYPNICFMFTSPCVYISTRMHLYISTCAHGESWRVEKVLNYFLLTGGLRGQTAEGGGRDDRNKGAREEVRMTRGKVWPWVFGIEVSGPRLREGVRSTVSRYWSKHKRKTFHLGRVMCSSYGNTGCTHAHTLKLKYLSGRNGEGGHKNKTHLKM